MAAGDISNDNGTRSVVVPSGGYTKGLIYLIGAEYVVARETKALAENCLVSTVVPGSLYTVTKISGTGEATVAGGQVYVNSSDQADPGSTGNAELSGVVFHAVALFGDTTAVIRVGTTVDS